MNLELQDKIIIVTGGAKGIGEAIVRVLAAEGAFPIIIGRDAGDNQDLVDALEAEGKKSDQYAAELTDPSDCRSAIDYVLLKYGRIDGLVNNAGKNDGVSLEKGGYDAFVLSLHRNLIHYYLMAHHALPALIKSKGSIVNISSKTGETGQGNTSAYAASNGGRNSLTREWAVELLKYRIRVNAIVVAECWTPQYAGWIETLPDPKAKLESINKRIPFENRMTRPEEIAQTAAFLLSNKSSHTTGQLIHVDGGYVHLDKTITE